ncbi:MAG: HAMP domain-containing sensor histidine kinase [Anaerolineae bacterium]
MAKAKADTNTEWLDTVAHDLRNPINLVSGCLDAIQNMGPLNERQTHYLNRAFVGLRRMDHLIARLKDISWIDSDGPLDLGVVNVKKLIEEAADMLLEAAEQHSITFTLNIDEKIGDIEGDEARLAQVMDNLISNAIKYNKDAGSVIVTATRDDQLLQVAVRDTGIGIALEDQSHVFERFFRAQEGIRLRIEGSGLGLAISQGIVHRHGGHLWLESEAGVGSTFFVSLPVFPNSGANQKKRHA